MVIYGNQFNPFSYEQIMSVLLFMVIYAYAYEQILSAYVYEPISTLFQPIQLSSTYSHYIPFFNPVQHNFQHIFNPF